MNGCFISIFFFLIFFLIFFSFFFFSILFSKKKSKKKKTSRPIRLEAVLSFWFGSFGLVGYIHLRGTS